MNHAPIASDRRCTATLAAVALLLLLVPAHAGAQSLPLPPAIPNFAGAGVGWAPEWPGSKDHVIGALPFGRLAFERGSERGVELYGTFLSANLVEHPVFRSGHC